LILTATWCASCDLSGQHGLVLQGPLELGVGMLPLDGDAEQARKAGKEIGIRKIELARAKPFAPAQIVTAISQLLNATPPVPPAE
jgi:hypothetical protein